jgi:hypothetical protein
MTYFWQIFNASLIKVLLKKNHDFKIFSLKTFMEYFKNKTIQNVVPKGQMWLMLLCLHPLSYTKHLLIGLFKDSKIWMCILLLNCSPNVFEFIMGFNILHRRATCVYIFKCICIESLERMLLILILYVLNG